MENLEERLERIVERILNEGYITRDQLEESLKEHESKIRKEYETKEKLYKMKDDISYTIDLVLKEDGNFRKHKSLFMLTNYRKDEFLPYIKELGYDTVNNYMLELLDQKLKREESIKEEKLESKDDLF